MGFKGVKKNQSIQRDRHVVDIRTPSQKMWDGLKSRKGTTTFAVTLSILIIAGETAAWMPGHMRYSWLPALLTPILFFTALFRKMAVSKDTLPFRMPKEYGKLDLNDEGPDGLPRKAGGVFFVGWCRETSREIWLTLKDVLTHILVLGTTGAGKTEVLNALALNAFILGGGLSLTDPKADPKLGMQYFLLCRIFGRDDDLRILNFSTQGVNKYRGIRMTNTTNPVASQTSEGLTNLMVSLMSESDGGNKVFAEKGISLVTGLNKALCHKRDRGDIELSFGVLRDYMALPKAIELASDESLGKYRDGLHAFLVGLGWQPGVPLEEHGKALPEQYSYGHSYFLRTLTTLTETYGHIYDTQGGQIDMTDAIYNRRVIVAMLPSLEKAPDEAANLGKITLTSQKEACAKALGDRVEGHADDVLDSRPSFSRSPFLAVTDEYEAIPTDGYEIIFTQGRSLNIIGILGTQSIPGLVKAASKAAGQILECTKVKLIGQITSGTSAESGSKSTLEYFKEQGGQNYIALSEGQHVDKERPGLAQSQYRSKGAANLTQVDIVHKDDLMEQAEGQFHMFFQSRMVRAFSLYTALEPKGTENQLRVPRMIRIPKPDKHALSEEFGKINEVARAIVQAITERLSEDVEPDIAFAGMFEVFDKPAGINVQQLTPASFINWFTSKANNVLGALGISATPQMMDNDSDAFSENSIDKNATAEEREFNETMRMVESIANGGLSLSEEEETISPEEDSIDWLSNTENSALPSESSSDNEEEEEDDIFSILTGGNPKESTTDEDDNIYEVVQSNRPRMLFSNDESTADEVVTAEDLLKMALSSSKEEAIADISEIEHMLGAPKNHADAVAEQVINDSVGMLSYPDPPKPDESLPDDILDRTVAELLNKATSLRLSE